MTFLSAAIGLSLFVTATASWCARLDADTMNLVEADHEMRQWARESLETVTNIEKQNSALDALDGLCVAASPISLNAILEIRKAGRVLALTQDALWKKLTLRLATLPMSTRMEIGHPRRGSMRVCVPGRLKWESSDILKLRSSRAGVRVAKFGGQGLGWRFESPLVRRRLQ